MTLAPLLNATPTIQFHAFAALAALLLGLVQFALPKGTLPHPTMGFAWTALMLVAAVSSFWIHTLTSAIWGRFSAIHLLWVFTLFALPLAVWRAHTHRVAAHRRGMTLLFFGALLIAGAFTLWPGRVMHDVVFSTHFSTDGHAAFEAGGRG